MVDNTVLYEAKKVHPFFAYGTATHVGLRFCYPTIRFIENVREVAQRRRSLPSWSSGSINRALLRAELTLDNFRLVLIEEERRYYSCRCPEAQEWNDVPEDGIECDEPKHNAR